MELFDLDWVRLVLDGPPAEYFLAVLALPVLGIPILLATVFAVVVRYLSAWQGVAIIAAALVLWFITVVIITAGN